MYFFWDKPGVYAMASNSLFHVINHLRCLGGDHSKWALMVKTNQGMVDVPILDAWF
jgi:hypothetical protein